MTLFFRRFREEARSLLTWSVTVALTSVLTFSITALFSDFGEAAEMLNSMLAKMPAAVRSMFGGEIAHLNPDLLAQNLLFATIAPILMMVFSALTVIGIYTKDAALGNLEFLFSLPVKRLRLAACRVGAYLTNLTVLHVVLFGAACAGAFLFGIVPNTSAFALVSASSLLLSACLGGLIFWVSMSLADYSRGVLVALGLQFLLFLLNMGLESQSWVLTFWNPYHYYSVEHLTKAVPASWTNILVLFPAAIAFWFAGMVSYIRKQV